MNFRARLVKLTLLKLVRHLNIQTKVFQCRAKMNSHTPVGKTIIMAPSLDLVRRISYDLAVNYIRTIKFSLDSSKQFFVILLNTVTTIMKNVNGRSYHCTQLYVNI